MIRKARAGDALLIESFLAGYAETSMFLRGNLAAFGLFNREHPRATTYWVDEQDGIISAVFGRSNAGFLMCQAPNASPELWDELRAVLNGSAVIGATGDLEQIECLRMTLGMNTAEFSLDRPEPLYRLELSRLQMPATNNTTIRNVRAADLPLLEKWHFAYDVEALGAPENEQTRENAAGVARRSLKDKSVRLLVVNNEVVAKTAFNAQLPNIVQIGGVYTPPALRCRGYGRLAVAMHLFEVHRNGVETAILFASGIAACKAYEAIGFEHIGQYSLAILSEPMIVGRA